MVDGAWMPDPVTAARRTPAARKDIPGHGTATSIHRRPGVTKFNAMGAYFALSGCPGVLLVWRLLAISGFNSSERGLFHR